MQERGAVAALTGSSGARLLVAVGVAAVVVAADQVTKSLAVAHLGAPVHVFGPFGLALEYNSGSAFSLFTGGGPVLAVVAVVMAAVLAWLAWRAPSTTVAVELGLVMGGALGNLSDRLFRGHHGDVVDFITLTHWPTFNVADACITVGIVLLVVTYWRRAAGGGVADRGRERDRGPEPDRDRDPAAGTEQ